MTGDARELAAGEVAPAAVGRLERLCVGPKGPLRPEGEFEKTCCPEAGTG